MQSQVVLLDRKVSMHKGGIAVGARFADVKRRGVRFDTCQTSRHSDARDSVQQSGPHFNGSRSARCKHVVEDWWRKLPSIWRRFALGIRDPAPIHGVARLVLKKQTCSISREWRGLARDTNSKDPPLVSTPPAQPDYVDLTKKVREVGFEIFHFSWRVMG